MKFAGIGGFYDYARPPAPARLVTICLFNCAPFQNGFSALPLSICAELEKCNAGWVKLLSLCGQQAVKSGPDIPPDPPTFPRHCCCVHVRPSVRPILSVPFDQRASRARSRRGSTAKLVTSALPLPPLPAAAAAADARCLQQPGLPARHTVSV